MSHRTSILAALRNMAGAAFRGHFMAIQGYTRYLLYRPCVSTPRDYQILQLLTYECGLPLNRQMIIRLLAKKPTIFRFNDGTRFVVIDLEDFYHASMCYERKTVRFISKCFKNGGVFVDVGANIGGYSIRVARAARVYAFEPFPRNFQLLTLNIKLNQSINHVTTFRAAAYHYVGKSKLFVSDFHGRHSLMAALTKRERKFIEVNTVTLDSALSDVDRIDVIKIDAEGSEPLVLMGAEDVLRRTRIVILEGTILPSFLAASKVLRKHLFKPDSKTDGNFIFRKM